MCGSQNPGTSPVLMSHWAAYEVLGSAQLSFLRQAQVSNMCLPMCHSDLSVMPTIRECKPSFHLFPYFRCPTMALKTRAHGRGDVWTQETVQQKVLGTEVGFKSFLFLWLSTSALPSPLASISQHMALPAEHTQLTPHSERVQDSSSPFCGTQLLPWWLFAFKQSLKHSSRMQEALLHFLSLPEGTQARTP